MSDPPKDYDVDQIIELAEETSEAIKNAISGAITTLEFGSNNRRALHRLLAGVLMTYAVLEAVQDDMELEQISMLLAINWERFMSTNFQEGHA